MKNFNSSFLLLFLGLTISLSAQETKENRVKDPGSEKMVKGIKQTTSLSFTSINSIGLNDDVYTFTGEPVHGAEVYIKLAPNDEPIANVTTDENGEFRFKTAHIPNFPKKGTLVLIVSPSNKFAKSKEIPLKKQIIIVKFKTPLDGEFYFILNWVPEKDPDRAQNKGAFAVSGKNST